VYFLDNILDIDLLTKEQEQLLNMISTEYGMKGMDYSKWGLLLKLFR